MSDCTFAMSDCISQMLETHIGGDMYQTCQFPIFYNANLHLPEMLHCISESVGLQINILSMCIKLVGRIAYYHRGHIALKHGSDWNIPMSEFHLAKKFPTGTYASSSSTTTTALRYANHSLCCFSYI